MTSRATARSSTPASTTARQPDGALLRQRQHALYRYCGEHGVPHRNCGKLIVATTPRKPHGCHRSGAAEANGVDDMQISDRRSGARARAGAELHRRAAVAIHRHHRQSRLHAGAARRRRGSRRAVRLSRAAAARPGDSRPIVLEVGGDAPMTIGCRLLVNAAGCAPAVARGIDGMPIELIPPPYLAKGNYFSCARARRFPG